MFFYTWGTKYICFFCKYIFDIYLFVFVNVVVAVETRIIQPALSPRSGPAMARTTEKVRDKHGSHPPGRITDCILRGMAKYATDENVVLPRLAAKRQDASSYEQ